MDLLDKTAKITNAKLNIDNQRITFVRKEEEEKDTIVHHNASFDAPTAIKPSKRNNIKGQQAINLV